MIIPTITTTISQELAAITIAIITTSTTTSQALAYTCLRLLLLSIPLPQIRTLIKWIIPHTHTTKPIAHTMTSIPLVVPIPSSRTHHGILIVAPHMSFSNRLYLMLLFQVCGYSMDGQVSCVFACP